MSSNEEFGNRCSVCPSIDFLPISCPYCQSKFCKDHIRSHSCTDRTSELSGSSQPLQRCALDGCQNPSLNPSIPTCSACQQSFCASHREPTAHSCSAPISTPLPTKNETARALLAKNFPSSSKTSVRRQPGKPTDPVKLAQYRKLELMKLRHSASPLDPKHHKSTVPIDNRRFFVATTNGKSESKKLWIEKSVIAGKALDLLSIQFGIPSTEINKYQLRKSAEELEYDRPLADQTEDGDELMISKLE